MTTTATPRQIGFIEQLIAERSSSTGVADVAEFVRTITEQRITKQGASALIDRLLSTPADPKPVVAQQADDPRGSLPHNRYGGKCVLCGTQVAEREGTYRRGGRGWETLHLPGQCPEVAERVDLQDRLDEVLADLPDGHFAVPFIGEGAHTDLTFFRISTNQGRANPANKGKRYVSHVVGGHGELDNVSLEWVEKAVTALRTLGVREAAALYGQHLGHCGLCGRTLTDQESRARGLGPDCAAK
jgi:hypothetical protein